LETYNLHDWNKYSHYGTDTENVCTTKLKAFRSGYVNLVSSCYKYLNRTVLYGWQHKASMAEKTVNN